MAVSDRKAFFDAGKALLGNSAGGQLNKLETLLGLERAIDVINRARDAKNPRRYIGAVIRNARAEADDELDFWRRVL